MDKYTDAIKMAFSAAVGYFLGGWDGLLQLLVFVLAVDYITGLAVAGVFKNSPKTENGALETRTSFKGLIRKCCIIIIVMIVTRLELTLGDTVFCRNTVIVFFLANEILSILENAGLMGVKYPKFIRDALEVLLKKKDGGENNG